MKKLLAILLTLSLVFAFAACGAKTVDEPDTTEPESIAETEAPATEEEAEAATEAEAAATEAEAAEEETEAAATEAEAAATEEDATEAEEEFNSTDPAEVVAFYNAARKATDPAPKGNQTMGLVGAITADGAIGAFEKPLTSAANSALS